MQPGHPSVCTIMAAQQHPSLRGLCGQARPGPLAHHSAKPSAQVSTATAGNDVYHITCIGTQSAKSSQHAIAWRTVQAAARHKCPVVVQQEQPLISPMITAGASTFMTGAAMVVHGAAAPSKKACDGHAQWSGATGHQARQMCGFYHQQMLVHWPHKALDSLAVEVPGKPQVCLSARIRNVQSRPCASKCVASR